MSVAPLKRWAWSDPIFDVSVVLCRGEWELSRAWMDKTFRECGADQLGKGKGAKTMWIERAKGCAVVIWLPRWFNASDSYCLGVLAHECFHAAEFVMRARGCPLVTNASDEAYAYYLAWVFRECHRRLRA